MKPIVRSNLSLQMSNWPLDIFELRTFLFFFNVDFEIFYKELDNRIKID